MDPLITNGIDPALMRVLEKRGDERQPLLRRKRAAAVKQAGEGDGDGEGELEESQETTYETSDAGDGADETEIDPNDKNDSGSDNDNGDSDRNDRDGDNVGGDDGGCEDTDLENGEGPQHTLDDLA
jgi:hypothetical protein